MDWSAAAPEQSGAPRRSSERPFFRAGHYIGAMGRSVALTLPLPRPSAVVGACDALVPGLGPECISMLDDWVNTVNELNSGSSDACPAAVLPLSAA